MSTRNPNPRFSWKKASEELCGLQDRITSYKRRFEDAGRKDISNNLEDAIWLLMEAQKAAERIDRVH
jgi:hypothetical protein